MNPSRRRLASGIAFAMVLLSAFTPWVSVSCNGTVLNVTGRELAVGRLDENEELGISYSPEEEADPEPFVVAAFILAAVGVLATILPGGSRPLSVARGVVGVGGLVAVIGARIDLSREITAELGDSSGVIVQWEFGWWLALLAFAVAAGLQFVPVTDDWESPSSSAGPAPPRPQAAESAVVHSRSSTDDERGEVLLAGEGTIMLKDDRGMLTALGGLALVVLSMGLDWASFSPGLTLDLGPLAMGISITTIAAIVVLDLARLPVPLERMNRMLGAAGLAVTAIVLIEVVRLLADDRSLEWGLVLALVGSLAWTTVGVARGWPEAVASIQASSAGATAAATPCARCGARIPATAQFCPTCGQARATTTAPPSEAPSSPPAEAPASNQPATSSCASCGAEMASGLKFCTACGASRTS